MLSVRTVLRRCHSLLLIAAASARVTALNAQAGPAGPIRITDRLAGDRTVAGLFAERIRFQPGDRGRPHTHSGDLHVTLIRGRLFFNWGERFDSTGARALHPGDFLLLPAGRAHFEWTDEPTEIHVEGVGPVATVYLEEVPAGVSRFTAGALPVVVRYQDAGLLALDAELRILLAHGLDRYQAIFGGPPRNTEGRPLDTLGVELASGPLGEAEADPGIIRVTVGKHPMFGFYDWRLTLLHEAFHLWNAESLRYADGTAQWFNEGASEFYAGQAAGALGILPPLDLANLTATAVGFYGTAPGLGALSLAAAGSTPELKRKHYFLIYGGGWTAALALDHDIRTRTAGARSLDDLLRRLYAGYDARLHRYANADLRSELRRATGLSYDDFFQRHVEGTVPIPLARHLSLGGLAQQLTLRQAGIRKTRLDRFLIAALGLTARIPGD